MKSGQTSEQKTATSTFIHLARVGLFSQTAENQVSHTDTAKSSKPCIKCFTISKWSAVTTALAPYRYFTSSLYRSFALNINAFNSQSIPLNYTNQVELEIVTSRVNDFIGVYGKNSYWSSFMVQVSALKV